MKKNKATGMAITIERAPLRKFARHGHPQEPVTLQIQQSGLTEVRKVPPPTEELVNKLNALGKEYPFCVNNKPGNHSIL